MKQFLKKLYEIYAPFRKRMLGVLGFVVVAQILGLTWPFLSGRVVDCLIAHRPPLETYLLATLAVLVYLLDVIVVMYYQDRYENKYIEFAVPRYMSRKTNEKLFSFSIGQHVSEHSGLKQSIITRGQHSLTTFGYTISYEVLPLIIELTLMIGALLYLSVALGLVVLAGVTSFAAAAISINIAARDSLKRIEDMNHENSRFQSEALYNAPLILTNAQEARMVKECDESIAKVYGFSETFWVTYAKRVRLRNLTLGFTRLAVTFIGIALVYRGDYTPGYLVVFWAWSFNALGRVGNVGRLQRRLMILYASVKKYFEMLEAEPDVKVMPNPVRPERFDGRIEFRNVTMRYRGRAYMQGDEIVEYRGEPAEPALKNVSFTVEPGETVAIVGESGAGKTSVVYALLRAQDPDEGQVMVDGNDLRVLDLHHFRTHVGVVEQFVPLFDNSIGYNIAFGLNGGSATITDEELMRVSKMASIDRFFERLEKGFDTVIGERGIKLSGGERQRVGIARALMKDPAILIFDEATSNLDPENEALIREAIGRASRGRTTLIIAHRFSTIRNVNRVIVLDKGRVVGHGTHRTLLQKCSAYQRLLQHQTVLV